MKMYSNSRYHIVEDDDIVSTCNKTDIFCVILGIIALMLLVAGIVFVANVAKSEAKAYSLKANQELCDLMEFNDSTYRCEKE